jgi:transcriptional regulator with XRE-family HTH domain
MAEQLSSNSVKPRPLRPRPDLVDTHVSKRLRVARMAVGMSQEALAERIGTSFQQVQKYESGINRMLASRLYALAQALGCTTDDFFKGLPVRSDGEAKPVAVNADVGELMHSAEGWALCKAFVSIKSPAERKAIIAFLRTAGETPSIVSSEAR